MAEGQEEERGDQRRQGKREEMIEDSEARLGGKTGRERGETER